MGAGRGGVGIFEGAHSYCWQEALILHHVVVSTGLSECPHDLETGSSLREWFKIEQGRSTMPFMTQSPKASPTVP